MYTNILYYSPTSNIIKESQMLILGGGSFSHTFFLQVEKKNPLFKCENTLVKTHFQAILLSHNIMMHQIYRVKLHTNNSYNILIYINEFKHYKIHCKKLNVLSG